MKRRIIFQLFLAILVLILATIACGTSSSNTGEKVGEVGQTEAPPKETSSTEAVISPTVEQPSAPSKTAYTVGEVVPLGDQSIVMNSVSYSNGMIKTNFTVENTGLSDVNVSSGLSFSAKSDDGTLLELDIFDCGTSMDGRVLPEDRLRGDICYKLPTPGLFKIYYLKDLLTTNPVVWPMDSGNLPAAVEQPTSQPVELPNTYAAGDIVKINDSSIVLNTAEIKNNLLKANFTITNGGSENVNISSLISFDAKAPDGTVLEQEYFDCGTALDGTIIPGDKLKGDICWKTKGSTPINVYFIDDFWSSGATVWSVK